MKKMQDTTKQAHSLRLQSYARLNRMQYGASEEARKKFDRKPYYMGVKKNDC
jgi:hypothetical protein